MSQKKIDKMNDVKEFLDEIYQVINDLVLYKDIETGDDADRLQKTAPELTALAMEVYKTLVKDK